MKTWLRKGTRCLSYLLCCTLFIALKPACLAQDADVAGLLDELQTSSIANWGNKVLQFSITTYGVQGDDDADGNTIQTRATRQLEFVTSAEQGYASHFAGGFRVVQAYEGEKARRYDFDPRGRIRQVTIDCEHPFLPKEFELIAQLLPESPWGTRLKGPLEGRLNVSQFAETLKTMEWLDMAVTPFPNAQYGLGIVEIPRPDREYSKSTTRHYFANMGGSTVWVGFELERQSKGKHIELGDCISLMRHRTQIDYARADGKHLFPVSGGITVIQEVLDFDFKPIAEPIYWKDVTMTIKTSVLDAFPQSLLDIEVPADAILMDNCERRTQQALAKDIAEAPARRRLGWMVAIGVTLIALVLAAWLFLRTR
jgi:hypothetical protein